MAYRYLYRENSNGQETLTELFNILNYQRNANQIDSGISSYTWQNDKDQKHK